MCEVTAFYAYPSKPASVAETVEEAIKKINKRGKDEIKVTGWSKINNTGKMVINEICSEINRRDLFLCDLSGLNPNVLFELGFAIAKNKRIWITLDRSVTKHVESLKNDEILSSIGYRSYLNDEDIENAFFEDAPFRDVSSSLLNEYQNVIELKNDIDVLYLKSKLNVPASKWLIDQVLKELPKTDRVVIDDPYENSYQPLEKHLVKISNSRIVIAHLLGNNQQDNEMHNAKYSFFAGVAYGFEKSLLMLAPEPFDTPFDYKNNLIKYNKAQECLEKTRSWLYPILYHDSSRERIEEKQQEDKELTLLQLRLGEGIAEYEEAELDSFFVPTGQYRRGIQTNMGIFIGRKGTGKTANLIQIREHFIQQNNNFVFVIKPLSFKLESYIKLIETYFKERDLRGDLTEKIWKFLIYTAIAEEIYNKITSKPIYYEYTKDETDLRSFVDSNLDIVCADFGEKLDFIYIKAKELFEAGKTPKSVLETIFNDYLGKITKYLQNILQPFQRIVILFDNLDKAWELGRDVEVQSDIILGLLGFQNTLKRDLQWDKGDTRILIFLREDIYNYAKKKARESDKVFMGTHIIEWDDSKLLLRIIEERFKVFDKSVNNDQVWEKFFCKTIEGVPTKEYLVQHIFPRPRDLIYVVSCAIDECINHGNKTIEEQDITKAFDGYFKYLVENISTEYSVFCSDIREIITGFLGNAKEYRWASLQKDLSSYINRDRTFLKLLEILVRIAFIGIVINGDNQFAYNENDVEIIMNKIKEDSKRPQNKRVKLVIHPAFYIGLKLTNSKESNSILERVTEVIFPKQKDSTKKA